MVDRQPHVLLCPPDFFSIAYEINVWMKLGRDADHERAIRQWNRLHATLIELGAKVSLVTPVDGLPDLVFTANSGMVYQDVFISSRFRHPQRTGESPIFQQWFESAGFTVELLPEDVYFEGAGDALFCGETLFGGYGFRSTVHAFHYLAEIIQCQALPLQLVDERFYHLDTCFCPIAPGLVMWYPDAVDEYARDVVREHVDELIEATPEEALNFGCNAVVIDRAVILPAYCPRLRSELEARGFDVYEVELDEFLKSGGSAKCLTFRIDGESAALWAAGSRK